MSSLFGGDAAKDSQRAQARATSRAQATALDQINPKKYTKGIDDELTRLSQHGFTPVNFSTPGYNINMNENGGGLTRTADAQGWIDRLLSGGASTDAQYGDLLSQLNAGFGRIGDSAVDSIRNNYTKAYGDLREQLAKRRVLGASFANDQLEAVKQQGIRDEAAARADATQKELAMTSQVIEQQHNARMQVANAGIQNTQYEGNLGAQLASQVSNSMQTLSLARTDLVKLKAQLIAQGQIAASGAVVNVNQPALSSFPEYANLQSQIDAGPMNFAGTLLGAGISGYMGRKTA